MRACSGDLERSPRPLLSTQVGEIRSRAVLDRSLVDRLERRRVDPSTEVLDGLVEVSHRYRLDTRERGLRRRLGGTHEPRQTCSERALGDRERPRDGTNPAVQRELAHGCVLRKPFGWKLPRGPEYGQRDREVEPRSFLAERGGRKVDRDPTIERPLQRSGDDAASDAMLGLLARAVREPDDGERRHPRLQVRLDLDLAWFEPDESMSHRPREHACTVPGRRSQVVTVFPERVLQVCYGV